MGDIIVDRHKVDGQVRFAQVEYIPQTKELIEGDLQVDSIPTLQVYVGQNKVLDISGMTNTKKVEQFLHELLNDNNIDLVSYAEEIDDGVLKNAIEDAFYTSTPSFLEEEW